MRKVKKLTGILKMRPTIADGECYIDLDEVRGVAKDYERVGAAIILLRNGGSFQVNESYDTVWHRVFDGERPIQ